MVLTTLGAPRASSRLRRAKPKEVDSSPSPAPLQITRVAVIRPRPFENEASAERWLHEVASDRALWGELTAEAAAILNRALHAHRTAASDPHIADVDPARAAAIRFGYGTGDEVAGGRWQAARELPDEERVKLLRRDYEALRPQERVAAVMSGREAVGAHEELILRARGDLDAGRTQTAVLQLSAGIEALVRIDPRAGGDLAVLEARQSANVARERVLGGAQPDLAAVAEALRVVEASLRRRALS